MTTRSVLTPASVGQQFEKWLASHSFEAKLCVLCHSDADGISAGAILHRTLRRSGREVATIVTQKFENAWSESVRDRLLATSPDALIVCDLGVRATPVLDAVPTCFIDHHYFSDVPSDAVVITGFQVEPCPTSGLVAFWCASAVADVSDLEWIAAVSLLSDSGERAPFLELTSAKKAHGLPALREATTLLNAARRSSSGNAQPALELLLRAASPREVSRDNSPEAMILREAKQEVNRAFAEAKRAAPKFSGPTLFFASTRPVRFIPSSRKFGGLGYPNMLSSARTADTAMALCISADAAVRKPILSPFCGTTRRQMPATITVAATRKQREVRCL
jgi:single-stranded-DNA-specific exonuclease